MLTYIRTYIFCRCCILYINKHCVSLRTTGEMFSVALPPPSTPRAVADPGFPRGGGANPKGGGAKLLFGQFFRENCMKMKKFWARGGGAHPSRPPLDPPLPRVFEIRNYVLSVAQETWNQSTCDCLWDCSNIDCNSWPKLTGAVITFTGIDITFTVTALWISM